MVSSHLRVIRRAELTSSDLSIMSALWAPSAYPTSPAYPLVTPYSIIIASYERVDVHSTAVVPSISCVMPIHAVQPADPDR
jgi:hypothetical protein